MEKLMVLVFVQGILSQRLTMDGIESKTNCSQGLIADNDMLTIKGIANLDGVNISEWHIVDVYRQLKTEINFQSVCLIDLNHCGGEVVLGCHCEALGGDRYQLGYTQKATSSLDQASIRFVVKSGNKTTDESEVTRAPLVYAKNSEIMTLTVNNNKSVDIKSETCSFSLPTGTNTIKLCCSNSPAPCEVTISLGDTEITGSPCAAFGHSVEGTSQGTYSFKYSVCGMPHSSVYTCQFSSSGNCAPSAASNIHVHGEFVGVLVTLGLLALCMSLCQMG